jgi:hypothetical protein
MLESHQESDNTVNDNKQELMIRLCISVCVCVCVCVCQSHNM